MASKPEGKEYSCTCCQRVSKTLHVWFARCYQVMGIKGTHNEIARHEAWLTVEDDTVSRGWGTADKAHQQNLIVKACLNMPVSTERHSARLSASKDGESSKKKKRFWVSCCPVAQRSETCLLPQADGLLKRMWSHGCFLLFEAPIWIFLQVKFYPCAFILCLCTLAYFLICI